jgi:metal-responsive CopG/Arc/MetJ family transcriptional regulator
MAAEREEAKARKRASTSSVRATISFPSALYEALEELAKQKKVSLAWVVRDATEQYVGDKWPLFRSQG